MRTWYGVRRAEWRIEAHAADQGIAGPYRFFFRASTATSLHTYMSSARAGPASSGWSPSPSRNHGFTARELNVIRRIIEAHRIITLEAWHEHCG